MNLKASRDEKGRPFGFIEYLEKHEAALAISKSHLITIMGRKIRAEHARCQRKIQVKIHKAQNKGFLEDIEKKLALELLKYGIQMTWEVRDKNYFDILYIILKFNHAKDSFEAFKILECFVAMNCPADSFELGWVSAKNMIPSINKMLDERSQLCNAGPLSYSNYYQMNDPSCFGYSCNGKAVEADEAIQYHFMVNDEMFRLERFSMPEYSSSQHIPKYASTEDNRTVFIGRINAHKVNEDELKGELSKIGTLEVLHLINRKIIGLDGVMLDAFASAKFSTHEEAFRCIQTLNRRVMFGQSVKCTWFQASKFNPHMPMYPPGFTSEDLFCTPPTDSNGAVEYAPLSTVIGNSA